MPQIDLSVLHPGPHEKPVFKEKTGQKWVKYGEDDQYATYLEELYYTSSIHNAIVNGLVLVSLLGAYSLLVHLHVKVASHHLVNRVEEHGCLLYVRLNHLADVLVCLQ